MRNQIVSRSHRFVKVSAADSNQIKSGSN